MAIATQPSKEATTKKKPITKNRRVVVTGLGVVSPVGDVADVFYENLLEGVSGISEIEAFNCDQFPTVSISFLLFSHFFFVAMWHLLIDFDLIRKLREKSSHFQPTDGLHQNFQNGQISLCYTC